MKSIVLLIFLGVVLFGYDGTTFKPKGLYLDSINSRVFAKFATSYDLEHKFIRDKIYPLGYNNRYFAYIIEHDNDPADIFSANFVIQDLVNDRVKFIDKFKIDDIDGNYKFSRYYRIKRALINRKLKQFGIKKHDIKFISGKLYYKKDSYRLYSKSTKRYYRDFDSNFLTSSLIYIKSAKKGSKVINKKYYKHPSYILAREPIGFLKLGNHKRAVVLVGRVTRGWEGPPHNISYEVVGANLEVGFK